MPAASLVLLPSHMWSRSMHVGTPVIAKAILCAFNKIPFCLYVQSVNRTF